MAVSIILQQPSAFDCKLGGDLYVFRFSVTGLSYTINRKRLTIQDVLGTQKVQATESGNAPTFTLTDEMGTNLVNGSQYRAQIEVSTDNGSTWSIPSPWKSFLCYTTPIFSLTGLSTVVDTSTYTFNALYNQVEREPLNTYSFNVYNTNGTLFKSSGTLSADQTNFPTTISYTVQGLLDNTAYSVEVVGKTLGLGTANPESGTDIIIPKTAFIVRYDSPIQTGQIVLTNNCQAGNIVVELKPNTTVIPPLTDYESVKIKRREVTLDDRGVIINTKDWLVLAQAQTSLVWGGKYSYIDKFGTCGTYYQYAYVPIAYTTHQEGDYVLSSPILSEFDGIFLLDRDTVFKFYSGMSYSNTESVQSVGVFEPLGSPYPKLVYNSALNYAKGGFEGNVIQDGYLTENVRTINRVGSTKKKDILFNFLKNKKSKMLKDWNGNNWLVGIVDNPNVIYDSSYGMGFLKCSFNWVEKGSVESQSDMDNSGMTSLTNQSRIIVNGPTGAYIELTPPSGNLEDMITGVIDEGGFIAETYSTGTWTYNVYLAPGRTGSSQKLASNKQSQNGTCEVILDRYTNVNIITRKLTILCDNEIVRNSGGNFTLNLGNAQVAGMLNQNTQTVDIIEFGRWSGYAYGYKYTDYSNDYQKQSIGINVTTGDVELTIQPPAILTVTDTIIEEWGGEYFCEYSLNTSTNHVKTRNKTIRLFENATWYASAHLNPTNQDQTTTIRANYGEPVDWTIRSSSLTVVATQFPRLNNSAQYMRLNFWLYDYRTAILSQGGTTAMFPVIESKSLLTETTTVVDTDRPKTQYSYVERVPIYNTSPTTITLNNTKVPNYIWNCGINNTGTNSAMLYENGNFIVEGDGQTSDPHDPQWTAHKAEISNVWINTPGLESGQNWFSNCQNLIEVKRLPTTYITNASRMFYSCKSLARISNLPMTIFNASEMFARCEMLETTPSMPNTLNYGNLMFGDCISLKTLPSMPNAMDNAYDMFAGCTSLTSLSSFPSRINNAEYMFYECNSLTSLPSFPSQINSAEGMFHNCYMLTGRLKIQSVLNYSDMFYRDLGGSNLYLDYTSDGSANIDSIVATKGKGRIYKGNLVP